MRNLLIAVTGGAVALLLAGACGHSGRGHAGPGDRCESNDDCAHGVCVSGAAGDGPACAPSCASNQDCPEGWSCGAVTGDGVVVCRHGASTPFGQ